MECRKEEPHCLLADTSVFVGFTSAPLGEEKEFIEYIKQLFITYREGRVEKNGRKIQGLAHYLQSDEEEGKRQFKKYFYQPAVYYLLGAFDLAILSLIEDFEFPVQAFSPGDPNLPLWENNNPHQDNNLLQPPLNFTYQMLVGMVPRWDNDETPNNSRGLYQRKLLKLADKTFLNDNPGANQQFLPLMGIFQIKLNTSFLVGAGTGLIRSMVKAMDSLFTLQHREKNPDPKIQIIILESYSWHELTLLVFTDSYQKIVSFIKLLRNLDLATMGFLLLRTHKQQKNRTVTSHTEKNSSYRADWEHLLQLPNLYKLVKDYNWDKIQVPALLDPAKIKSNQKKIDEVCADPGFPFNIPAECQAVPPFGTHILFSTASHFCFSAELLNETKQSALLNTIADDDRTYLFWRWNVKAGHDTTAAQLLKLNKHFLSMVGRSDMLAPCERADGEIRLGPLSSRQLVQTGIKILEQLHNYRQFVVECIENEGVARAECTEHSAGVFSRYAIVGIELEKGEPQSTPRLPAGHISGDQVRKKFAFSKTEIDEVYQDLRKLQIHKVITERVLNAFNLLNDGIVDNFTFSTFLELKPYLEKIREIIKEPPTRQPDELGARLNLLLDNFEAGWRNRFYGGWHLGEVTDFNIDFKGGIQQILSAISTAYRLISWALNGEDRTIAVVTGEPGIAVDKDCLRLSFFDIFAPEFFAARVGHEASEQLLEITTDELDEELFRIVKRYIWTETYQTEKHFDSIITSSFARFRRDIREILLFPDLEPAVCRDYTGLKERLKKIRNWLEHYKKLRDAADKIHISHHLFKERCKNFLEQTDEGKSCSHLSKAFQDYLKNNLTVEEAVAHCQALEVTACRINHAVNEKGLDTLVHLIDSLSDSRLCRGGRNIYQEIKRSATAFYLFTQPLPYQEEFLLPLRVVCKLEPLLERVFNYTQRHNLFNQIFADICNYMIIYGEDAELFTYQMLGNFVVEPSSWKPDYQVDRLRLQETVLRTFLTISSAPEAIGRLNEIKKMVKSYFLELGDETIIDEALSIGERTRTHHFARWCKSAYQLASVPLAFRRCRDDWYEFTRQYRNINTVFADDREAVRFDLNEAYERALFCLEQGRVCPSGKLRPQLRKFFQDKPKKKCPIELDHWFDFCSVAGVLRAYLTLTKKYSGAEPGKNVLKLKQGAPDTPPGKPFSRFHPRGGFFTNQDRYRRYLFMLRAAFTMSLQDIAEKVKFRQIEYELKEKELLAKKKEEGENWLKELGNW